MASQIVTRHGDRMSLNLWPKQKQVFDCDADIVIVVGSPQGGKSAAIHCAMCKEIRKADENGDFVHKNHDFFLMANGWKVWNSATRTKFLEIAQPWGIIHDPVRREDENQSKQFFTDHIAGNRLHYCVAEHWEKLRGPSIYSILADELQHYSEDCWNEILDRVSATNGRILANMTAPSPLEIRDHFIWPIYEEWKDGNPRYQFFFFTWEDSPLLRKNSTHIMEQKRKLPPEVFKARYEANLDVVVSDDQLYPREAVDAAMHRHLDIVKKKVPDRLYDYLQSEQTIERLPERDWQAGENLGDGLVNIGVDPAGKSGNDDACVGFEYNDIVVALFNLGSIPLTEIESTIAGYAREIDNLGFYAHVDVESIGLGEGIADHLVEQHGVDAAMIRYQSRPEDSEVYARLKPELYFKLRERLLEDPEFVLPWDMDLRQDMLKTRWGTKNGKNFIHDQKPSPDELDAVIMAMHESLKGGIQVFI